MDFAHYGYLILFIWALLEGETALLLAGFAVQQGKLNLGITLGIATIGAFFGDQFWFHLARRHGKGWLLRRPRLMERALTAQRLLERHATLFILSFRFIYGMRNLGAMVVGVSDIETRRFVVLNFIAALIWAVTVILGGYFFGSTAVALLENVNSVARLTLAIVVVIAIALAASWLLGRWLLKRLRK